MQSSRNISSRYISWDYFLFHSGDIAGWGKMNVSELLLLAIFTTYVLCSNDFPLSSFCPQRKRNGVFTEAG